MRKSKIICTLGPSVDSDEKIRELILNGMDCARLNFSHGTHEEQKIRIGRVKRIREELNAPTAILLDTKGPEIRTCSLVSGRAELTAGQFFTLDNNSSVLGDSTRVATTYPELYEYVHVGTEILVDDGKFSFEVVEIDTDKVKCLVKNSGTLCDKKSINIPDTHIPMPYISEKDKKDILFGIEQDVDFIAASFVRSAEDVADLRALLDENGGEKIQIISKIENLYGIENLSDILELSDGLMVARGDLGVEIPFKKLPIVQKSMIEECRHEGKLIVTATQMLDSMTASPRPTRAEVSDVANAIFDGTSVVMLSGETAAGKYPVESVRTMSEIVETTESAINFSSSIFKNNCILENNILNTTCISACKAAKTIYAKAILTVTRTGKTAEILSAFHPSCPIIAATVDEKRMRQLNLRWGVTPSKAVEKSSIDELIEYGKAEAKKTKLVKEGDIIVIVIGSTVSSNGVSDTVRICKID